MILRIATVAVFLVCSAMACGIVGCASPGILGGPTKDTTSHPCEMGGTCPTGYDCPPLANPQGECEAQDNTFPVGGKRPRVRRSR